MNQNTKIKTMKESNQPVTVSPEDYTAQVYIILSRIIDGEDGEKTYIRQYEEIANLFREAIRQAFEAIKINPIFKSQIRKISIDYDNPIQSIWRQGWNDCYIQQCKRQKLKMKKFLEEEKGGE